jgi:broad specificity phosphatase PhoE
MPTAYFVTHPDVEIEPAIPVTEWRLTQKGRVRMSRLLEQPWTAKLCAVWCSEERKASEAAEILARPLGLLAMALPGLGENDRTATGYMPKREFEVIADAFFAKPELSIRGWERAVDAQHRIVAAVEFVMQHSSRDGDIAIVSHGAVGALYLCHLQYHPISRQADQPPTNGGNFFAFDAVTRRLCHGWRPID